jgi:hypothetical protein
MKLNKTRAVFPTLALATLAGVYASCAGSSPIENSSSGGSAGQAGGQAGTGGKAVTAEGGAAGGTSTTQGGGGGGAMQMGGSAGGPAAGGSSVGGGAGGTGTAVGGATGFGLGGPSRCATSGALLCEDFENGLDAATWAKATAGDGTVEVDELHAARGKKALHVHTGSGSGHAWISEKKTFPIMNNMLFGRMYVWFEDAITTDGHFSLAEGAGTGTKALIRFGGQYQAFGVGTDQGPSGDWTDKDKTTIPNKKWLCMEFQFKSDTNEFRVWWDDQELTSLRSGPSKHPNFTMPQFTSLWFGWWMYNKQEPQDLWIDDIAVSNQPIGCAK